MVTDGRISKTSHRMPIKFGIFRKRIVAIPFWWVMDRYDWQNSNEMCVAKSVTKSNRRLLCHRAECHSRRHERHRQRAWISFCWIAFDFPLLTGSLAGNVRCATSSSPSREFFLDFAVPESVARSKKFSNFFQNAFGTNGIDFELIQLGEAIIFILILVHSFSAFPRLRAKNNGKLINYPLALKDFSVNSLMAPCNSTPFKGKPVR